MLNKSIAYRLSIYISLAVISVFIAFIIISFLFNFGIIKENIEYKAKNTSIEVNSRVRQYVVTTQDVTDNISGQIIFYDKKNAVRPYVQNILKKYPFINAIHINLDSVVDVNYHNFYAFSQADSVHVIEKNEPFVTCVNEDSVFQHMLNTPNVFWSDPIVCSRNEHIVVSYFAPVYETVDGEKKRVGEVICELSLLELNESLNKMKVGEDGYSVLLSRNGLYLTHPRKEWIMKRNVYNLPKDVVNIDKSRLSDLLSGQATGMIIARPEQLNYQKSWVSVSRIEETGWVVLMVVPYSELFEPLYLPLLKMLFFAVLGILVVYILITYISNRQIQPLSSLTSQLKRFSDISGEAYEGDDSLNEIKQVSESLDLIKTWYEKNKLNTKNNEKLDRIKHDDIFQAAEIQQSLIKSEYPAFPDIKAVDLYSSYKPARIVSGDLFDYFFRDEKRLVFTNGDVSGKGVPAAFFMSVAQTIIKTVAANLNFKKSSAIVREVNEQLYSNNVHQFFLTLFLGILNIKNGKLKYCNAAHTTAYVLKADGKLDRLADSHGLPLGLYREKDYEEGVYQLEEGDSIIVYTDGVTELQDENNMQYGTYRLEENLKSLSGLKPKEMVRRLEKSLKQFIGDTDQIDDITILILKYYGYKKDR